MAPYGTSEALADIRRLVTDWKKNADETRAADTESWGWQIDRMGERDDTGFQLVEAWEVLDSQMTNSPGAIRPEGWRVPPLTEKQYASAVKKWPELAVLGEDLIKELSRHHGIHYVRWMAQRIVKNTATEAGVKTKPSAAEPRRHVPAKTRQSATEPLLTQPGK
ncbi:hypothetical protein ACWD4V_01230 [Streptomyces tsukubensis]